MNEIEKRYKAITEAAPDKRDKEMLTSIKRANDNSDGITLAEMDVLRTEKDYSGKISLRVPKTLHRTLIKGAKEEGISLNQFILYKLAQ